MFRWRPEQFPSAARVAALGATLALLCLTFAACSRRDHASPAEQILRISQRNEPATLDPHLATLPDEFFVIRTLSEGLVVPNPDGGTPLPGMATRWETSPDGLTWTFHLRPDAQWSNGDPFTAHDFVYSFRRILAPALAAPKANLLFVLKNAQSYYRGQIADETRIGVSAPDPRTLVLKLAEPTPHLLQLAASGPWLPVHPATLEKFGGSTVRDGLWTDPGSYVGNGPFILTEWRKAQHVLVSRNPSYHAATHIHLSAVRFLIYDSGETEERAFRAGQVDITMSVPFTKLANHPAPILRHQPLIETRYFAINTSRPPRNDPRVRRALALAIDREAIVANVLRGAQQPALNFLPPNLGTYRSSAQFASDTAAARGLLADAGFRGGYKFPRLELSSWNVNPAILEAIQQMWRRELGIETSIIQREGKVHMAAVLAGDFAIALMPAIPDYNAAAAIFTQLTSDSPDNITHWKNAEYDDLVRCGRRENDPAIRLQLYRAAEDIVLSELPVIPLYFNAQDYLVSPRVHDWRQDGLWNRFYQDVTVTPAP